MTASELAEFVARVRRLFGGQMDEELFAIAKERIAGLRAKPCEDALSEYALMHGGSRMRFIPAKFLDFYLKRVETATVEVRSDRIEQAARREIADAMESERIARQWSEIRERIAAMDQTVRFGIIAQLRGFGWHGPPAAVLDWPSLWLLAVDDIALERVVFVRDPESGRWDIPLSAVEFYGSRVPRPQDSSREAVAASAASEASLRNGRPSASPSGSTAAVRSVASDVEEIPF